MVSAGQGDETGAGDAGGQLAPALGTIWSSRACRTSVGAFTSDRRSVMSKSPTTSKYRAAHSDEVVFRCSSLK